MDGSLNGAITAHFRRTEEVTEAAAAATLAIEATVGPMDEEGQEGAMHHEQQQEQKTEQPPFLTETHLYDVEEAFSEKDLYWKENVRSARFDSTLVTGILYRPNIVDALVGSVKRVLLRPTAKGIMVKGPEGIGKSHTLVNLVRKLVYDSNNRYMVTFIPDCEKWTSVFSLLDVICASFGISSDEIKKQCMGIDAEERDNVLKGFIAAIDIILKSMGKQWVFVFDQINKLFVKPINLQAKDASGLLFRSTTLHL
jgi:Cdc6-like AAA superfamily ATPase